MPGVPSPNLLQQLKASAKHRALDPCRGCTGCGLYVPQLANSESSSPSSSPPPLSPPPQYSALPPAAAAPHHPWSATDAPAEEEHRQLWVSLRLQSAVMGDKRGLRTDFGGKLLFAEVQFSCCQLWWRRCWCWPETKQSRAVCPAEGADGSPWKSRSVQQVQGLGEG